MTNRNNFIITDFHNIVSRFFTCFIHFFHQIDEAAREVRSHIKTYINQKQNAREGFTETFKPLIETSEAVKTGIDKEQNAMIEQLQKNQLALTEGLNKNRLAITSGFDKMDEVKRSDLLQLPSFEAIEHPEMKKTSKADIKGDEITYKISNRDLNEIVGTEIFDENEDAFYNKKQYDDLLEKYDDLFKKNIALLKIIYHQILLKLN